jgi:GTP-binding protein
MVDIRDGIMPLDQTIAQLLRKNDIDVIGVANKADTAKMFPTAGEFTKLGFGEFLCISAKNNLNKSVLLDRIFEKIVSIETGIPKEPVMKLAIVGKRNAGKSTIVNAIAGSNRVIVSETPGTSTLLQAPIASLSARHPAQQETPSMYDSRKTARPSSLSTPRE